MCVRGNKQIVWKRKAASGVYMYYLDVWKVSACKTTDTLYELAQTAWVGYNSHWQHKTRKVRKRLTSW